MTELVEHYSKLFQSEHAGEGFGRRCTQSQGLGKQYEEFEEFEVEQVIDKLKNGKSTGGSWVSAEVLKGHK